MSEHPWFRRVWYAANLSLFVSLLLLVGAIVWEYSTREYLRGFAEAIVPLSAPSAQKVEAILAWMREGPARRVTTDETGLSQRDPEKTLNYQQLLQVCGTATNAFVNLAASSGLRARRLLLLTPGGRTKHVVAEVYMEGRWVVVDPAFRTLLRDDQGHFLTRQQLRDPRVLQSAVAGISQYPPEYTYEATTHVRLARIPLFGGALQRVLDEAFPSWEESFDWTLLLERESFELVVVAALALFLSLLGCLALGWYGSQRLGIAHARFRDNLFRMAHSFFTSGR